MENKREEIIEDRSTFSKVEKRNVTHTEGIQ